MTYNTKYILQYCNKDLVPLKIELQLPDYVGEAFLIVNEDEYVTNGDGDYIVMNIDGNYNPDRDRHSVDGSVNPFSLTYRNDTGEKGGTVRATEANMEFFEDLYFNIDDLASSDEMGIRCVFYFDNQIEWIGYVVPDFFNVEITENPIINLTASDRIGILKDISYDVEVDNSAVKKTELFIINKILKQTGLELNTNIVCDFLCQEITYPVGSVLSHVYVSEERFLEENGSKNCYDILKGLLDKYNCLLTQYKGEWWIFNKEQLELGVGTRYSYNSALTLLGSAPFSQSEVNFNLINSGGQRTIIPAGGKNTYVLDVDSYLKYPKNGSFKEIEPLINFTFSPKYWTKRQAGLSSKMSSRIPIQYSSTGVVSDAYDSQNQNLLISNNINTGGIYSNNWLFQSQWINLPSLSSKKMDFDLNILAIGKPNTTLGVMLILEFDNNNYKYAWSNVFENGDGVWFNFQKYLNDAPPFNKMDENSINLNSLKLKFPDKYRSLGMAVEHEFKFNVSAANGQNQNMDLTKAKMCVRIYPTDAATLQPNGLNVESVIKHIKIDFKRDEQEPKSVIFQSTLNANYTKSTVERKVMFGDYQDFGQNGYLYPYRKDSLSIHYNIAGQELRGWRTIIDNSVQPLLTHSLRQLTKSYSRAHDELSIGFDMKRIDPFAQYSVKCFSEKYVQVEDKYLVTENGQYVTALKSKYLNNKKYVFVEGTIDYLRSVYEGKLAQVITNSVDSKEYIYSDF